MDEQHTESRLREELRHAVDNVQVPSDMWARIRRRHRREPRQRMLAVATSMALLAIVAAAAFPVVRDAAQQRDPVGDPSPDVTTTGPTLVTEGPMPTLEGESELAPMPGAPAEPVPVLATGVIDGHRWMFTVFVRTDGRLVWGFPQPERDVIGGGWTSGSRNPLRDDPLAPSVQIDIGTSVGKPSFVYGPVVKDAAVVRVQTPDGDIREVPTVGQDAGFAANFYAAPIPAGVSVNGVRVTAHDANGRQVGQAWSPEASPTPGLEHPATTTTTPASSVPGAPPESWNLRALGAGGHAQAGAPAILAQGSASARDWTRGEDWTLVAYPMGDDVCFGFLLGTNFSAGQGWCAGTSGQGDLVPPPQHLNPSEGSAGMVLGPVDKDATRVRLTYPSGRTVELTRVEGGVYQRDGLPAGFFMDIIPEGEPATSVDLISVRSFDAAGRQLGAHTAAG